MYEERRLLLKMTKPRRRRRPKRRTARPRALDTHWEGHNAGAPAESADGQPSAQLLVRKRSVPTARHSNILSAISERRAQREARVRAFLDEKRSS